jgi:putative PIN family toxin of toxin-antitoxin system
MLVVLDTNVLVSGLLNGGGKPGQIINLLFEGHIRLAYDDRILGEYEDVLFRPEFRLKPANIRILVAHLELTGLAVEAAPLEGINLEDTGDVPFAEVFVSSGAQALVTGNLRHFTPLLAQKMEVISRSDFLAKYFPRIPGE